MAPSSPRMSFSLHKMVKLLGTLSCTNTHQEWVHWNQWNLSSARRSVENMKATAREHRLPLLCASKVDVLILSWLKILAPYGPSGSISTPISQRDTSMGSMVTAHQSSSVTPGEHNAPGYADSAWLMHKIMLMSFTSSGPEVLSSVAMCFTTAGRSHVPDSEEVPVYKSLSCGKWGPIYQALIRLWALLSTYREKEIKRSLKAANNSIPKFSCPFAQCRVKTE